MGTGPFQNLVAQIRPWLGLYQGLVSSGVTIHVVLYNSIFL